MEGRKERMEKVFATRATWDINMMQNRVAFCLLTLVLCLAAGMVTNSTIELSLLFRNWPSLYEGVLDNRHCKFLVLFSSGSNGKAVMSLLVKGTLIQPLKKASAKKASHLNEWKTYGHPLFRAITKNALVSRHGHVPKSKTWLSGHIYAFHQNKLF